MLKIITAPNPILSQTTKPALRIDTHIRSFIREMEKTLLSAKDPEGVGLAAPQVGKSLSLFIAKPTPKSPISVFINPKIIQKTKTNHLTTTCDRIQQLNVSPSKKSSRAKLEGCLSLPNIWGEVKRDSTIKLRYQLISGNELVTKTHTFSGLMATIVQHEMDHLQGILFPKRVLEQKGKLYKSRKNEKGEDEFEEIEI